tara:strand:+ start:891 stop:2702 length:1812 start_codon:yes stop_codon:yes gene_type:complete
MTTYRQIHGKAVKTVTTNPSDDAAEGQIWFNSTDNTFKSVVTTSAWSSASPLNTARSDLGGFGVRDASVIYGGSTNATEEYNGSGFSAGGNLNTGRPNCQDNGWGVETAAVVASGYDGSDNTVNVEEYNGSSFSEVSNVSTARRQHASIGLVQTAGAICGGYTSTNVNSTEEYDGTNWTSGGNLTTTRRGFAGSGTLTAGIVFSGYTTTVVANTEEYDGTSWTAATATNTARNNGIGASNAPQSTALLFGGNTGSDSALTEQYNGTSWTEVADMATARDSLAGSGIGTAALASGGLPPPGNVALAEEFNQSATVVTAGAWASGGNLNTSRREIFTGPVGSQTSGLASGGATGPTGKSNATEEYDGSSWTTVNTVPVSLSSRGGAGTQAAALFFGGNPNPTSVVTTTEYDGTNYSAGGDLNSARGYGPIAAGTQTAALAAGGHSGSSTVTTTEFYNGTAWTAQPNASPSVYTAASGGTQTAAWFAGGLPASTEGYNWDGTSWTASGNFTYGPSDNVFGGGPQTAGWLCGGNAPSVTTTTNHYDGTSFFTAPNMGTARYGYGQAGDSSSSLIFGGAPGPGSAITNATEEFTGETTALNVKTLTQS